MSKTALTRRSSRAERHALGQRVGDDQQPLAGGVLDGEAAVGERLVVALGRDLEHQGLVVAPRGGAGDARADLGHDLVLLERRQAEQHGDAESVEHDEARLAGRKGERRGGDEIGALEAAGVDSLAEQQRARRHATHRRRRGEFGRRLQFRHERFPSNASQDIMRARAGRRAASPDEPLARMLQKR